LLDADLYVPALLEGFLGSRRWLAQQRGQLGGAARSPAKAEAARSNGRLGGWVAGRAGLPLTESAPRPAAS